MARNARNVVRVVRQRKPKSKGPVISGWQCPHCPFYTTFLAAAQRHVKYGNCSEGS